MKRKFLLVIALAGCMSLITACSLQEKIQSDAAAEEQVTDVGMEDRSSEGEEMKDGCSEESPQETVTQSESMLKAGAPDRSSGGG